MRKLTVSPFDVAPWHHENTFKNLVQMAKELRLAELGIIPVYESPEGERSSGKRWVLMDGHTRRAAACIANSKIEVTVVETPADLEELYGTIDDQEGFNSRRARLFERAERYSKNGYFPKLLTS